MSNAALWKGAVVLAVVACGCIRVVLPRSSGSLVGLGEPCAADEACVSGHCADNVCCQTACGPAEACNLARSLGACTVRTLGDWDAAPVEVAADAWQWGPAVAVDGPPVAFWAPDDATLTATGWEDAVAPLTLSTVTLPCSLSSRDPLRVEVLPVDATAQQAWVMGSCRAAGTIFPVVVPFTRAAGFGTPSPFPTSGRDEWGPSTLARLGETSTGVLVFERVPGDMVLSQQDAQLEWHHSVLTPPILWGERIKAVLAGYGARGPALAWSADRQPQATGADGGVLFTATSSRVFLWRPRATPP